MTDELKWMKTKLLKMEALNNIRKDSKHFPYQAADWYEQMGLIETLQIKSIEMYGHDKIYIGLYTECGDYNQLFK